MLPSPFRGEARVRVKTEAEETSWDVIYRY